MRAVGRCCLSKPNLLAQTSFILFSLVIAAWTAPLLSTNPAYTPQVADTVGPSGVSHYQLLGPGRATFAAFGYWDEFAMLNTTTAASGALSVLSTSYYSPGGGESWASTELDMACHYSVYQRVTSFADPWRDGAYRNDAASGTRVTLEAPNCRMLTAHRVTVQSGQMGFRKRPPPFAMTANASSSSLSHHASSHTNKARPVSPLEVEQLRLGSCVP